LVKEKHEKKQLFLDEGGSSSSSDTDTEAFFSTSKGQQTRKGNRDTGLDGDDDDYEGDEDDTEAVIPEDSEDEDESDEKSNEIASDISADEDDDEAPEELSSKRINTDGVEQPDDEWDDEEKEKTTSKQKSKRKKRTMAAKDANSEDGDGVFDLEMGDSQLKVVVLDKTGPSNFLNPQVNFREELLRLSTEESRVTKRSNLPHVNKWRRIC